MTGSTAPDTTIAPPGAAAAPPLSSADSPPQATAICSGPRAASSATTSQFADRGARARSAECTQCLGDCRADTFQAQVDHVLSGQQCLGEQRRRWRRPVDRVRRPGPPAAPASSALSNHQPRTLIGEMRQRQIHKAGGGPRAHRLSGELVQASRPVASAA